MSKFIFLALKAGLLLLLMCSYAIASAQDVKKVFIVQSYSSKNICGAPQRQGVEESLAEHGFDAGSNLRIYDYAMDTKRVNNTPESILKQAEIVLAKIEEVKPDVLVLLDDNAFRTVGLELAGSDMNIVFSGMNGQPEVYNQKKKWLNSREKPGHNITGVYEKLHVTDAFRVQKMILPDLKKVLIISDESPTGKAVMTQVNQEIADIDLGIDFDIKIASSWEDYKSIIGKACADSEIGTIYPAATLLTDKSGGIHSTSDIIRWTVKNCRTPGISINYSFARLGMLGGAGVDFISMGRQAGNMVVEILKGASPGDIAIEDAKRYALVFNLKRAKELGIKIPTDVLMAADVVYK
ncbi:ABC transporter substrate-binding protein [Maridesulfovibrio hydrothermalis]|uniref:ABC transporter substrate binding protein n=1 Tax=Maridesulfovibrio hydrothermalis AM13 = DSM 14728 TaxID=1121451 RepID=L0RAK9_9BACT|nr:ABC transporter substrate binding protein [Maridesulfovibrio hydrothermalis]CCO23789.1 conserved exported protein of unknown function [Maridesulfovibrio hydrothermalis AM13 = DSM 14728]